MFTEKIPYVFDASKLSGLPRMFEAKQCFATEKITDVTQTVNDRLDTLPLPDLRGKRIALTGGSRGVANQALILRSAAAWLKRREAEPFVVPAMGSHGGASAEGQREVLAGYGITEDGVGVPVLSGMDTVELGATASGYVVHCDANAYAADYIMPIHRVKPHTGFKADIESGLCKMMVIGLGKHKGAASIHSQGVANFGTIIPEAAEVVLRTGKILAGIALVENAHEETMIIEAVQPANIIERDKALLVIAKKALPRICAASSDILVVEEIGKDISGTGMDPNVTGRAVRPLDFGVCRNRRIVVLSLSPESHGNAAGIGLADVTTREAVGQIDFSAMYTNSITAGVLEISRLPIVANNDMDAIRIAICATPKTAPEQARIIHIKNTLELTRIRMSEAYLEDLAPEVEQLSEPAPIPFDEFGRLTRIR